MWRSAFVSLLALSAIVMANNRANSEGAIAEGIAPGGIAKGYVINIGVNKPDRDTARAEALAGCRKGPKQSVAGAAPNSGMARARTRCEVVTSFSNKCAAAAVDPKDGTPGAGWATGDTQKDADDEALARCRSVAGTDRREFCKVIDRFCDGTAK
jgi:hypothetical protein